MEDNNFNYNYLYMKNENIIRACIGESAIQSYIERCGIEIARYFMLFDTHVQDITDIRRLSGKCPEIMYDGSDVSSLDLYRLLAYNRIGLSREADMWLQDFSKKIIESWTKCRREYDILCNRKNIPNLEDYLDQGQYAWVHGLLNRKI